MRKKIVVGVAGNNSTDIISESIVTFILSSSKVAFAVSPTEKITE